MMTLWMDSTNCTNWYWFEWASAYDNVHFHCDGVSYCGDQPSDLITPYSDPKMRKYKLILLCFPIKSALIWFVHHETSSRFGEERSFIVLWDFQMYILIHFAILIKLIFDCDQPDVNKMDFPSGKKWSNIAKEVKNVNVTKNKRRLTDLFCNMTAWWINRCLAFDMVLIMLWSTE